MQEAERVRSINTTKKEEFFNYCYGCSHQDLPDKVILTPFLPLKKFGESCDIVQTFKGKLYSGIVALKNNVKFAVIRCGMGSQIAGDAVLLLGSAPVEEVLFVGACGGLGSSKIGDLIICEKAFDGGSFSRSCDDTSSFIDIISRGELISADTDYTRDLEEYSHLRKGNIFTIASLCSELSSDIKKIEDESFFGIDMELASIYAASKKMNIRSTALLVVSDLPLTKPLWEVDDSNKEEMVGKLTKTALGFIAS